MGGGGLGPGPGGTAVSGGRVRCGQARCRGDSRFRRGSPGNTPGSRLFAEPPGRATRRSWWGSQLVTWRPSVTCGGRSQRNAGCARTLGHVQSASPQESRPPAPPARLQPGPLCWLSCLRGSPHLPWGYHWSADIHSSCLVSAFSIGKDLRGMVQGCVHCLRVFPLELHLPPEEERLRG